MRSTTLLATFVAVLAVWGSVSLAPPDAQSAAATHDCGLPDQAPLWVEYGEGAVPPAVRAVFSRPGIVVAASGTALPKTYRAKGASTVYFVLKLPRLVGTPGKPADPASIQTAADALYERAVASTTCAQPRIGLNELLGPAAATPWTPTTATYRANLLALVRRLAERGARPALFVHGVPNVAGDGATWWRELGRSADVVYEAYYKAPNIHRLGRIVGPRRVRLGMRAIVRLFVKAGIPRERIGFALGFQVKPGTFGREGLQPRESWLRVVKWHALAARQVSMDERTSSIWSWGWGNFGPQSVDPDKPAAACVYLWSRDTSLCDGLAAAGPGFNRSRVEGLIVIPPGVECISAAGKLRRAPIDELTRLTRNRHIALNALFARHALRAKFPVSTAEILAVEQQIVAGEFQGSQAAYVSRLQQFGASVTVARGIIGDELRRQKIAAALLSQPTGQTTLTLASDAESAELDTATCLRDELPGSGDFPRSDKRDIGVVPLPSYLRFLLDDITPPAPVTGLVGAANGGQVVLDWDDGAETDLAGYTVVRVDAQNVSTTLTSAPLARSTFTDTSPPRGTTVTYFVLAMDTAANSSPEMGVFVTTPP